MTEVSFEIPVWGLYIGGTVGYIVFAFLTSYFMGWFLKTEGWRLKSEDYALAGIVGLFWPISFPVIVLIGLVFLVGKAPNFWRNR